VCFFTRYLINQQNMHVKDLYGINLLVRMADLVVVVQPKVDKRIALAADQIIKEARPAADLLEIADAKSVHGSITEGFRQDSLQNKG